MVTLLHIDTFIQKIYTSSTVWRKVCILREIVPNAQCILNSVYFSAQPNKLRPILKFEFRYPIEHLFVPAGLSVRKIHFFTFLWFSHSRSVISPKICPCIHHFFPKYAPVSTPSSYCIGHRVIKETGALCWTICYTLCNVLKEMLSGNTTNQHAFNKEMFAVTTKYLLMKL